MIKKLRMKFVAVTVFSTSIVLLILMSAINIWNYININNQIDTRLSLLSENRGGFGQFDLWMEDQEIPSDLLINQFQRDMSRETPFDTRYFYAIFNQDGELEYINMEYIVSYSQEEAQEIAIELFDDGQDEGFVGDYKYRKTMYVDSGRLKTMYVILNCERELSSFRQVLLTSIFISLLGVAMVTLLVIAISSRVVKPIAESYAKQKRFITDASHEIKTPLTIIDANTEIIEMDTGENEWTEGIHKQIKQLTDLTNKLVFLSKMDEENLNLEMTTFNLSELIQDSLDGYEGLIIQKNRTIKTQIKPNVMIEANKENITRCIGLLMDNAIKYSKEDSEIRVILEENNRHASLRVVNDVEDMEDGNHDELFDRFYRLDASRNSKTGGHGIGLSVVYAIINAHKGKIHANCLNHQFEIMITL